MGGSKSRGEEMKKRAKKTIMTCQRCRGTGRELIGVSSGGLRFDTVCGRCEGKGKISLRKDEGCPFCDFCVPCIEHGGNFVVKESLYEKIISKFWF